MDVARTDCMVSVVCITYNHENYIRDALESFVNQKVNFPYEILVGDDASTDGTADIIREYEARYPSLVRGIYQTENLFSKGISQEEILFDAARGKYIAYCEGDDYWLDDAKLQMQVDYLEAHPDCAACVGNTIWHYCTSSKPDTDFAQKGDCDFTLADILNDYLYHISTLVVRSELLRDRPEYYYLGLEAYESDATLSWRITLAGKIHYINRVMSLYRYRSNPESMTVAFGHDRILRLNSDIKALQSLAKYTNEEQTKLVQEAILLRKFDLLHEEDRNWEMYKEPYRTILRQKSLSYRIKNLIKCVFPWVRPLYRKWFPPE